LALRLYFQLTAEVLPISMSGQHLGSVDYWLCQLFIKSLGTAASNYRASCARLGVGFLLLRRACCGLVTGGNAGQVSLRTASWGTQWGQLNWLPAAVVPCVPPRQAIGVASATSFLIHSTLSGVGLCASALRCRIVIWLILPVVICLSQRLSHACLSISNYTVKLRMAH
jgi:hypothetical protein